MRKMIAGAITALLLMLGFAAGAVAAPGDNGKAGPNGHNEKGLCTAYFNGQKKGHEEGNGPGPFGVLEDESADPEDSEDEDLETEQQVSDDVFEFCNQFGIMGNPEQNGRFDCREDESRNGPARDSDDDGEVECVAND